MVRQMDAEAKVLIYELRNDLLAFGQEVTFAHLDLHQDGGSKREGEGRGWRGE